MRDLPLALATEPVSGWRVWRVMRAVDRDLTALELAAELLAAERRGEAAPAAAAFRHRLWSLSHDRLWPARGRFEARCTVDGRRHADVPGVDCTCGVWAFKERADAIRTARGVHEDATPVAVGQVALWGRLVEHAGGWRARFAYPLTLELLGRGAPTVTELAGAYAVEAVEAVTA